MALVPVTVLYSLGYRFDRNFVLRKTGGLYIASDVSGSEIFINGEFERRTNLLQSGVFVQNLAPNKYKVLVAREGYLGWSKELQIFSRFVSEARAVLVPAETNGKIILKGRFSGLGASHDGLWLIEKKGAREVFQSYDPENNILGATSSSPVPALSEKTDSRGYAKAVWNEKMSGILSFFRKDGMYSSPLLTTACGRWNWMAAAAGEVIPSIKERSRISRSSPATTFFMSWTTEI